MIKKKNSTARFNSQRARVKIQHLWSQYSTLKNDPRVNFQPGSKYFVTQAIMALKVVLRANVFHDTGPPF
jgi:hypothetical protein